MMGTLGFYSTDKKIEKHWRCTDTAAAGSEGSDSTVITKEMVCKVQQGLI